MNTLQKKIRAVIILFLVLIVALAALGFFYQNQFSLKLVGEPMVTLDYQAMYEDPGAQVYLNGKVSHQELIYSDTPVDSSVLGEQELRYSYQWLIFHKDTFRKIVIKDLSAPVIELNGSSNMTLFVNETFTDPGVTVTDNVDQDIQSKVQVSGSVDVSQVGTYELVYRATDQAGNSAEVKRTVLVQAKAVEKKGVVYLTFDDGPNGETTGSILDTLSKYGVKATFFVTGAGPDQLLKREFDEGHTIALHTYTHKYNEVYASVDAYFNDLNKISDRVFRVTGVRSTLIRFPGGSSNGISAEYCKGIMSELVVKVREKGYQYFDWNVSSEDAGGAKSPDQVFSNVTKHLSKNHSNVVLMHDIKPQTRDALERIIRYCLDNGYELLPLTMDSFPAHHPVNN